MEAIMLDVALETPLVISACHRTRTQRQTAYGRPVRKEIVEGLTISSR